MPANTTVDLDVNGHQIPATEWTWGSEYPRDRRWTKGWGTAIEVPAVIELLDLIESGQATAAQVKAHLAHAADAVIKQCDIYQDDDQRNDERCFGDCDRCESNAQDLRSRIALRVGLAEKARDSRYTHVVTSSTVHVAACSHVTDLATYTAPESEDDFRAQLRMFTHQNALIGSAHTPVTGSELAAWCAARRGPQGGRKFKACKTCTPVVP